MTPVTCEIEKGIATVTMDDGRANIMNHEMLSMLRTAFEHARQKDAAVILRSALPKTYSAGFDIKVFAAGDRQQALEMVRAGGELLHAMLDFPRPVIAVADGHIFPMGLFTLLAADYRIGTDRDYFWCLNEAEIGIVPPVYAFKLLEHRLVGPWLDRAVMTAARLSPHQGLEAGVFDELVPGDDLSVRSRAVAERLASLPSDGFGGIKRRLKAAVAAAVHAALEPDQILPSP